jgi:hypothetical protein
MGAWLPQALHARRQTLRDVLAQLERQQARLLDGYLAEVIEREEVARRRKEVAQSQQGFTQPLRQRDTQAQQHVNVAALRQGMEAFGQRLQPTLDTLTFAQRRHLVEWLIDRVIVNDTQVEIRSVVPTGPNGETTPFCHLRLDYLNAPSTRGPLDALNGVVDGLYGHGGPQQPLDGLDLGWRIDSTDLHGPQRHGRQALSLAVTRWTQGQGTIAQRQCGLASKLWTTPRHLHDDGGDDGLGLDGGPHRALWRADTAVPRGAHQQIDAFRAPRRQHVVDIGFPIANAHQAGVGTAVPSGADGVETVEPLLTFLLADGELLAPGPFADVVRVPRPDLLG